MNAFLELVIDGIQDFNTDTGQDAQCKGHISEGQIIVAGMSWWFVEHLMRYVFLLFCIFPVAAVTEQMLDTYMTFENVWVTNALCF